MRSAFNLFCIGAFATATSQYCTEPVYDPSRNYPVSGMRVVYNSAIYTNNKYVPKGYFPDSPRGSDAWTRVSSCIGRIGALSAEPKDAESTVPCSGVDLYAGRSYAKDEHTIFNSRLWVANWQAQNAPSETDPAWSLVGRCDKVETPACVPEKYAPTTIYAQPTTVTYNSHLWKNKWWVQGVEPTATSEAWLGLGQCSQDGKPLPTDHPTTSTTTTTTSTTPTTTTSSSGDKVEPKPSSSSSTTTTTTTTTLGESPSGPTGPNGECIWPLWTEQDYPATSYVGLGQDVYQASYYASKGETPTSGGPWKLVSTCTGEPPKSRYTDEEMIAMLDPTNPGIQVIYDPLTAAFPSEAALKATEEQLTSADPMIAQLRRIARVLPLEEIEKIVPDRSDNPENVKRVERVVSAEHFEQLFPVRHVKYTYENLLRGVGAFPEYCRTYEDGRDSDAICKKMLAISFAHHVQETGANWSSLRYGLDNAGEHRNVGADAHYKVGEVIPLWKQALWFLRESGWEDTATSSPYEKCGLSGAGDLIWAVHYPCSDKVTYFGRGGKQLSWNYNYGQFSQKLFGNANYLLENPGRVADTWLNFASGVWFAVTPQSPKPPMTWVIDGTWVPNAADKAVGLTPGFGASIVVINGGVECGSPRTQQVKNRIEAYKNIAEHLGVPILPEENLDCDSTSLFPAQSSASTVSYWDIDWSKVGCKKVATQTPFRAEVEGDYKKCVDYFFRSHYFKGGKKIAEYGEPVTH